MLRVVKESGNRDDGVCDLLRRYASAFAFILVSTIELISGKLIKFLIFGLPSIDITVNGLDALLIELSSDQTLCAEDRVHRVYGDLIRGRAVALVVGGAFSCLNAPFITGQCDLQDSGKSSSPDQLRASPDRNHAAR